MACSHVKLKSRCPLMGKGLSLSKICKSMLAIIRECLVQ